MVIWALIILTVCVTTMAYCSGSPIIYGIAILSLIGVFIFVFIRLIQYAEKNPYFAIFNGGQLLLHERLIHSKNKEDTIDAALSEGVKIETSEEITRLTDEETDNGDR